MAAGTTWKVRGIPAGDKQMHKEEIGFRPAVSKDVAAICELHLANSYENIGEAKDGFLRTPITNQSIDWGIERQVVFVAVADERVIGYYLVVTDSLTCPLVAHLVPFFDAALYNGRPFRDVSAYYGAQACIARPYRRHGIASTLFSKLTERLRLDAEVLGGSITTSNGPGVAYNLKQCGWKILAESDGRLYVVWDLGRSNEAGEL